MILNLCKIFFSFVAFSGCVYCLNTFGVNPLLIGVAISCVIVVASIFVELMKTPAKVIGNAMTVISVMLLALLILAGTIGGSFNLSPSNQAVAGFLFFTMFFGFTSFYWPITNRENLQ